jgi:hypothetical protein
MPKQSLSLSLYAIEVARRQSDGTWRWLIGDPFTVGGTSGQQLLVRIRIIYNQALAL